MWWEVCRGSVRIGVGKCVEMWESVGKYVGAWGEVRRDVRGVKKCGGGVGDLGRGS